MHLHLSKYSSKNDGNYPVYVCANDIQCIEYSETGTLIKLVGGNIISCVVETPREILEFLQTHLPDRWE